MIYSIAAPRRTDEETGKVCHSVIKPVGSPFEGKTVNIDTGVVSTVKVEPATDAEIDATVAVMGGSDWKDWIKLLLQHQLLVQGACTVAFSYIGPEQTHAIYTNGTIGRAKADLELAAHELSEVMKGVGGKAFVSVNKALVTQASSAIPVVPLYITLLYKVMKEKGLHEGCMEQARRLFERLYGASGGDWEKVPVGEKGRIRLDDLEMRGRVKELWGRVSGENLFELADIQGYRNDFLEIFGFHMPGIDYNADVDIL